MSFLAVDMQWSKACMESKWPSLSDELKGRLARALVRLFQDSDDHSLNVVVERILKKMLAKTCTTNRDVAATVKSI